MGTVKGNTSPCSVAGNITNSVSGMSGQFTSVPCWADRNSHWLWFAVPGQWGLWEVMASKSLGLHRFPQPPLAWNSELQPVLQLAQPADAAGMVAIRWQLCHCCNSGNSVATVWGGKIGRAAPAQKTLLMEYSPNVDRGCNCKSAKRVCLRRQAMTATEAAVVVTQGMEEPMKMTGCGSCGMYAILEQGKPLAGRTGLFTYRLCQGMYWPPLPAAPIGLGSRDRPTLLTRQTRYRLLISPNCFGFLRFSSVQGCDFKMCYVGSLDIALDASSLW
ncbi:hypothetical protein UY3_17901 [Chelonia mydas]|uniref:Uncharacterized protein n=1 Tax=Chelonia mydas TaxID=8469 RepID=M7AQB8_CHEMY|nr:hypothetical protein UY3_17901 [Chelonia mydas]